MKKSLIFVWSLLIAILYVEMTEHLSALTNDEIHLEKIKPELLYELQNDSGTIVAQFKSVGIPLNIPINLKIKRLDGSNVSLKKVRVNDKNQIVDLEQGKLFLLSFGKFAKGETLECLLFLETEDAILASVFIAPYPIQVNDEFGHALTMKIINAEGTLFHLEGSGFEPYEKLIYSITTEKDPSWNRNLIMRRPILRNSIIASHEGKISKYINPKILSLPSGKASVEILGMKWTPTFRPISH